MNFNLGQFFRRMILPASLLALAVALSACVAMPPGKMPDPEPVEIQSDPVVILRGDEIAPRRHVWLPLTAMFAEEPDFGMYTYVLFGRKLKPRGRLGPETMARYESLLRAIHLSTLSSAESGISEIKEKRETNLFLIPLEAEVSEPTRHNYDSVLSLRCLSFASRMVRKNDTGLAQSLLDNEGPFLISTLKPMGDTAEKGLELLYADLSSTNPAAMAEIVGAYKRRIGGGLAGIERFRSLRLALLDAILDADDHIKIVKSALAGD